MRVLLISPLAGLDPACGDITYTETLLANPPEGVEYVTYADALRDGTLIENAKRARVTKEPVLTLCNKAINVLRRRRILYWEPFRFFSVKPGAFDVIHCHVFNARFLNLPCPLVVTSGAPQPDLYVDRRGYSAKRVAVMGAAERLLGKMFGVNCNSYHMPQAQRILVYTEHYRDYLVRNGYAMPDQVAIVPIMHTGVGEVPAARQPKRIGFVARDFKEKGGHVLLRAFAEVRRVRPDAELTVVGCPCPFGDGPPPEGVSWLGLVPREQLLRDVFPTFDVFAYPTPHDCFSYVMLEAMACGLAVATSDYVSMPEAVDFGKAGLISPVGDWPKLAENILALLEPATNQHFRSAAKRRFDEHFSCQTVAPKLLRGYQEAIAAFKASNNN